MSNLLTPSFWEEWQQEVMSRLDRILDYAATEMMSEGRAFGDRKAETDGDVVSRYVDLEETGAREMLQVASPHIAAQQQREFNAAMRRQIMGGE